MENLPELTLEEMKTEAELFRSVYPALIGEIVRIEKSRGKLNDFQLMAAVSYAKNGLGVLSYERRQTINAVFEAFTAIYRKNGIVQADQWVQDIFGCGNLEAPPNSEETKLRLERLEKLSVSIQMKEAELLELYREFYLLQNHEVTGDLS